MTTHDFDCSINDRPIKVASTVEFIAFERELIDTENLEFWIYSEVGPMLCMLKNRNMAWLMYLSETGDSGSHSTNQANSDGSTEFVLSNGQIDYYPNSWCIPLELCIKAIREFITSPLDAPKSIIWTSE